MNGSDVNLLGAQIITPHKFEFGEFQLRKAVSEVKKAVGSQGGQMPVPDPMGLLGLGVILDKLTEISDRLDRLEATKNNSVNTSGGLGGAVV